MPGSALKKNALREMVNNFADDRVGCVSGELMFVNDTPGTAGEGLGIYWTYEKFLRMKESRIGSMLGATGALYAIRKKLYIPPDEDTLLDDMVIPLKIIEQGYRAIFDQSAHVYDTPSRNMKKESERKVRTLAGNWQLFFTMKNMFNPFKSPIAFQLFSHKFLRVIVPYCMIIVFLSNLLLLDSAGYRMLFLLQSLFYLCALCGFLFYRLHIRLFNIPYTFCSLHVAAIGGLVAYAGKFQKVTWKKM